MPAATIGTDPRYAEVLELAEACKTGEVPRVLQLLKRHPPALNSPDRDTRFVYPGSCAWSPLWISAMHGHTALVRRLLKIGANPVPYEFSAQYHHHTYANWTKELRDRGYDEIAEAIIATICARYGPLVDSPSIRQAVLENDLKQVRRLINENPKRVRQVDEVGNSLLHLAVKAKHIKLAQLLIDQGATVDALNGDGRTPLVVSLFGFHRWWPTNSDWSLTKLLLKAGAKYTMLIAATVGDHVQVKRLIANDGSAANDADACFRRPLSGATSTGQTDIVRLLLEAGADPNAKEACCQGGYSLYLAAWNGQSEIARMLLNHGAVPERWVDSAGDSLYAAYRNGHKTILQMLYAHGGSMELSVYAAAHRIDVIAEVLKTNPSRCNEVFPHGWDENGSEEVATDIMRLAIHHGARFENASEWNMRWTVLKFPKLFKLLQEHGADAGRVLRGIAGDWDRRYTNTARQLRCVKFLVEECGADVNWVDEEGLNPLAAAARQGNKRIVSYLLKHGAKPSPQAPDWAKPYALARAAGHESIARLLKPTID